MTGRLQMRLCACADSVFDLGIAQIGPEQIISGPADKLTPAVGQDFLRERAVAIRFFQQINVISNRLAMKQIQSDNIARIIIQTADDKGFFMVRHGEIYHVRYATIHWESAVRRTASVREDAWLGTASPLTRTNAPAKRSGLHVF